MPKCILLTGFGPFAGMETNPTQLLMEALASTSFPGAETRTAVLDVDYQRAGEQFRALVEEHRPDAVVSFGVALRRPEICIERVAVNLDCSSLPDNAGVIRQGEEIVPGGPPGYWSTLPVNELHAALLAAEIPVRHSGSAGGYLCNHVFYYGRHLAEELGFAMGFIHVPALANSDDAPGMTLERLVVAGETSVRVLSAPV